MIHLMPGCYAQPIIYFDRGADIGSRLQPGVGCWARNGALRNRAIDKVYELKACLLRMNIQTLVSAAIT